MKITVRLVPNHPTGSRRRAGFVFGAEWQEVDANKEQTQEIKNDEYLLIKGEKKEKDAPQKDGNENEELEKALRLIDFLEARMAPLEERKKELEELLEAEEEKVKDLEEKIKEFEDLFEAVPNPLPPQEPDAKPLPPQEAKKPVPQTKQA